MTGPASTPTRSPLPFDLLFAIKRMPPDPRLGATHAACLYGLVACVEDDGSFSPSIAQLAAAMLCSANTARRAVLDLEGWGYLKVTRTVVGEKKNLRNRYELVLPRRDYSQPGSTPNLGGGYSQPDPTVLPTWEGGTPNLGASETLSETLAETSPETDTSASRPSGFVLTESPSKGKSERAKEGKKNDDDVSRVFDRYLTCWREKIGKGGEPKLNPKRRSQIAARLKEGYDIERMANAFSGLLGTEWNVTNGQTHIELVIRDGAGIEKYEAKAVANRNPLDDLPIIRAPGRERFIPPHDKAPDYTNVSFGRGRQPLIVDQEDGPLLGNELAEMVRIVKGVSEAGFPRLSGPKQEAQWEQYWQRVGGPLPPDPEPEPMTPEEREKFARLAAEGGRSSLLLSVLEDDRNHVVPAVPRIAGVRLPTGTE